jgi:PKD repeat protein
MFKKMINKKNSYTFLIALSLFLVSFAGIAISEKEIIEEDSKDYTHTVMVEVGTASWCPSCPPANTAWHSNYESGNYDFEYCEMVIDHNPVGDSYMQNHYNLYYVPSNYFDGGAEFTSGSSGLTGLLDDAGSREVYDIDAEITKCYWLDTAEIEIEVEITNNEASTYDGDIRVYVIEKTSTLWNDNNGNPYYHAFLDFAMDETISISSGSTHHASTTWDGSSSYPGLTYDNCQVILAVFNDEPHDGYSNPPSGAPFTAYYVDETTATDPILNIPPVAGFSYSPQYPEESLTVSFFDESSDSDGNIVSWNWDFGDGSTSTDQNPSHEYLENGYYTVSLTVEDDSGDEDTYETTITVTNPGEMVGASQANYDRPFLVRHASDGDWGGAQDFIPTTITTITKAELYMKTLGTPSFDLTVELREDSIDGTLLDSITMNPGDFSSDWDWIELNFSDVSVAPGTNYFIVLSPPPSGITDTFGYGWGYALGDMYDDGSLWFTRTSGSFWLDLPDLYEFCFTVLGE